MQNAQERKNAEEQKEEAMIRNWRKAVALVLAAALSIVPVMPAAAETGEVSEGNEISSENPGKEMQTEDENNINVEDVSSGNADGAAEDVSDGNMDDIDDGKDASDGNAGEEWIDKGEISDGDLEEIKDEDKISLLKEKKLLAQMNSFLSKNTILAAVFLGDYVNAYTEPDFNSQIVGTLPAGQTVILTEVTADTEKLWYRVSFAVEDTEYEGYIARYYLASSQEEFLAIESGFNGLKKFAVKSAADGSNNEEWAEYGKTMVLNHHTADDAHATLADSVYNLTQYQSGTGYSDIDQFPESYWQNLLTLKRIHPNWVFVKQNTGLDWNVVVANEQGAKSLVPSSSDASWKVAPYDNSWSYASEGIIKYYLDPRNALTENGIFQFEQLTYNASYHTVDAVQQCLNHTFMAGKMPGYDITYAQAFTVIGSNLKVSPFHLASRVYQEQGKGTSPLISGTYPGYEGYYNYFNIGASGTTNQQVILSGLQRAKKEGWDTRDKSIGGGAQIISANYILKGQDTLYLQKFDVDPTYYGLYVHQYMQNIMAPSSEAITIKNAYRSAGTIENSFVFKIPVYNNMPEKACPVPTGIENASLKLSKNEANTQIYVRVSDIADGTSGVKVAVWSDVNGQDDLVWYDLISQGNNAWAADVNIANHKYSTGVYNVHLYANSGGKRTIVTSGTIQIDGITGGKLKISSQYEKEGIFTAGVTGLTAPAGTGITGVRFAVWSEVNGQDDLKWYPAQLESGVWKADIDTKDHGYDTGKYNVHAYATDLRGVTSCVASGVIEIEKTKVSFDVEKSLTEDGFIVNMYHAKMPRGCAKAGVAVWSEKNGQDDLKWYQAVSTGTNSYQVRVNIWNHKMDTGDYNVHVYYQDAAGKNVAIIDSMIVNIADVECGSFVVENINHEEGTFRARVTDPASIAGVESVKFAVWSEVNGQDDLLWYTAQQSGNQWYADIDTANHSFDDGAYQVHGYVEDGRGINRCIGSYRIVMDQSVSKPEYRIEKNAQEDQIQVTVANVKLTREYAGITVPAWSEAGGEDDIIWYNAKKTGRTTYEVTIPIKEHNYDTGDYNVHIYYKKTNGVLGSFIGGAKVNIGPLTGGKMELADSDERAGIYTFKLSSLSSPAGISNVQIAVWSEVNGQDDLKWYDAVRNGEDWEVTLNTAYHQYDSGKYQVHAYATDARGIRKCFSSMVLNVKQDYSGITLKLEKYSNNTGFAVKVNNAKVGRSYGGIMVAVWSDKNGQDDLIWYKASKTTSGNYEIPVSISNHKNDKGNYNVHVYLMKTDGSRGEIMGSDIVYLPEN